MINACQLQPSNSKCCMQEEELLRSALAFYRLMAAWLLRVASPAVAAGHPVDLPLPTPAPADFRMLPVRPSLLPCNFACPADDARTSTSALAALA